MEKANSKLTKEGNHLILPEAFAPLENIKIKGYFSGYYNDFSSKAEFTTNIGNIKTDIVVKKDSNNVIQYNGKVDAINFDIGKISSINDFGKANFHIIINGSGLNSETLLANLTGEIDTLNFRHYKYHKVNLEGSISKKKFEGNIKINDENIYLDFNGIIDYSDANRPKMDFASVIKHAYLNRLNLVNRDSISKLSTSMRVNLEGDMVDSLRGEIHLDSSEYTDGTQIYSLKALNFSVKRGDKNHKILKLTSDYADATIEGDFIFSQMKESFTQLINAYIPSFYKIREEKLKVKSKKLKNKLDTVSILAQKFDYDIKFKNTEALSKLLLPILKLGDNSEIKGKYNSLSNSFSLQASSHRIDLKHVIFKNFELNATAQDGKLKINTECNRMHLTDSIWIDKLSFRAVVRADTINYKLTWNNNLTKDNTFGDISGNVSFKDAPKVVIDFNPSNVEINDSIWNISNVNNKIIIDSSAITINNFEINSKGQKITATGIISKNPESSINIIFSDYLLSNLNIITSPRQVDLGGIVNGKMTIKDIYKSRRLQQELILKI